MKELQSYIAERLSITKTAESDIPKDRESAEYIQYIFKPFEKDFKCTDCSKERKDEDGRIVVLEPLTEKAHNSISKYTGHKICVVDDYDYIFIGKYDDKWYGILEYNYEKDDAGDMIGDFLGPHDDLLDLRQQFCEKLGF